MFAIPFYQPQRLVNNYWTRLNKICQWRAHQLYKVFARHYQITIFAITEFNKCFIIRPPSLFFYFNRSLTAQGGDLPFSHKNVITPITNKQNIICNKTY